uniref:GDNF/GAS1 domain-containing protein n=1 Tax=Acrobeloides nanus TaxID=290746 RepID=A0A914DSR0_9BILA
MRLLVEGYFWMVFIFWFAYSFDEKKSTCQSAFKQCDQDETCKWHLSELQMKCKLDDNCIRGQCAAAIGRFSRYVSRVLVEPMMFCQCSFSDGECKHLQQWMYPRCLYVLYRDKPPRSTCTHAIKLCRMDSYCQRNIAPFNETCTVLGNKCVSKDPEICRVNLISIRGTQLESPCYCSQTDEECLKNQNLMLPNNPCVEEAMSDYSKNNPPLPEPIITPISPLKTSQEERVNIQDFTLPSSTSTISPEISTTEEEIEVIEVTVEKPPIETTTVPVTTTIPITITPSTKERKDLGRKEESKESEEISTPDKVEKKTKFNNTTDKAKTIKMDDENATAEGKPTKTTTRKFDTSLLTSDAYMTQAPPPEGGCRARNIDGDWINHYKNTLVRQYADWSARCSSWCECTENETLTCQELPCLPDGGCKTDQTSLAFGERLYLENRGACICQSGKFICDTPADMPELEPGLEKAVSCPSLH